ncbi:MAG: hypothetical protein ABR536_02620 [Solirubrobacterales bacterium]
MRAALNENPVAQAVVIGVLLVITAFMVLTQLGGKKETGAATPPSGVAAAPSASGAAATGSGPAPASVTAPSVAPTAGATASFEAGPGLPRSLVSDHQHGRTIVLLIAEKGGFEDAPLRAAVERLKGDRKLSVHVTDAKRIARYAQITQGVGVSQVPALVVVSPNGTGGGQPTATASYGFRSAESVNQAVRDAVYRGVTRGYDPG